MTSPAVNFHILSGGLGNSPPSPAAAIAIIGCSSAGVANTVSGPYASPSKLATDYGYGPGPELVAALVQAGLQPYFIKTPNTTPGAAGAVTHTGTGEATLVVSGAANDSCSAVVTMTRTGVVGVDPEPGFTVSLDGSLSASAEIRMPASGSYVVPNTGHTLAFTGLAAVFTADNTTETMTSVAHGLINGDILTVTNSGGGLPAGLVAATNYYVIGKTADTFQLAATSGGAAINITTNGTGTQTFHQRPTVVAGDTYTFTSTAPLWGNSDITAAMAALKNSTKSVGLIYVVGPMNATAAGVYSTALAGFLTSKKFERAIGESVDISSTEATWISTIAADYVAFTDDRISIAATPILYPSAISGVQYRRSIGWPYLLRLGQIAVSQSAAEVATGALPNVTTVYHDEAVTPGLDADRFVTATSIPGLVGYYITRPNIMHSVGSDFSEMQYGRIMDEACRITYNFFVQRLNSRVRLNKKTGFILEKDARGLESGNDAKLNSGLTSKGDVSSVQTVVSRIDDISSTKTLTVTVKILPPGYIETVDATLVFTNPALGGG